MSQAAGDVGRAASLLRQSVTVFRDPGDQTLLSAAFGFLSVLAIRRGAPEIRVQLLGAVGPGPALFLPQTPDDRRAYDESVVAAQAAMGGDVFAEAWAEGQTMTLDKAVTHALEKLKG
jgi:hypothetical protein